MAVTFQWLSSSAIRQVRAELGNRLERASAKLEETVKQECPVRTGRLRASIRHHTDRERLKADVSAAEPYAPLVDRKNPFFERGIERAIPLMNQALDNKRT